MLEMYLDGSDWEADYFISVEQHKTWLSNPRLQDNLHMECAERTNFIKRGAKVTGLLKGTIPGCDRTFLLENDIRFLETKGGSYQDTSFAFKALSLAKRVLLTPKAYLHYRIDNENSSVNNKGKVYAICDEYKEIAYFLTNNLEKYGMFQSLYCRLKYGAYVWNYQRLSESLRLINEKNKE